MQWTLALTRSAKRELANLKRQDPELWSEVLDAIIELQGDPFPSGSIQLRNHKLTHRIRVRGYRVIYQVSKQVILVSRVRTRNIVYQGLERNPEDLTSSDSPENRW